MSEQGEITIEFGRVAHESKVLVDGKEVGGVFGIDLQARVGEMTTAAIYVYPEEVTATVDEDFVNPHDLWPEELGEGDE